MFLKNWILLCNRRQFVAGQWVSTRHLTKAYDGHIPMDEFTVFYRSLTNIFFNDNIYFPVYEGHAVGHDRILTTEHLRTEGQADGRNTLIKQEGSDNENESTLIAVEKRTSIVQENSRKVSSGINESECGCPACLSASVRISVRQKVRN